MVDAAGSEQSAGMELTSIESTATVTSESAVTQVDDDTAGFNFQPSSTTNTPVEIGDEGLEKPQNIPPVLVNGDSIDSYKEARPTNNTRKQQTSIEYYASRKYYKLFTNPIFIGRIFTLILTILLLALSITYSIAQLLSVKLQLLPVCEPKKNEEIWKHSYETASDRFDENGNYVGKELNAASQWGHTNDVCWTTNTFDLNSEQKLWYSNDYKWIWIDVNAQFFMFSLAVICCFIVIVYNIMSMITDIICVHRNNVHTKSYKFNQKPKASPSVGSCMRMYNKVYGFWQRNFSNDHTGWIFTSIMSELFELMIQSQALLLYNGYKDENSLAHKAEFIILFSLILAFNAFGSGIVWLSYSLGYDKCNGLIFKFLIFFVDQSSDLLYTVFPFIVLLKDDYNKNTQTLVLLGQLTTNSPIAFISAFFPLILLCNKSFFIIYESKWRLHEQYYDEWKVIQMVKNEKSKASTNDDIIHATSCHGYNINLHEGKSPRHCINDESGNFAFSLQRQASKKSWIHDDEKKRTRIKQIFLSCTALLYIAFGLIVLSLTVSHINHAKDFCNSISEESLFVNGSFVDLSSEQQRNLDENPELFYWNKCLYKTYPFAHVPCQCRVAVIDWDRLKTTAEQRKQHLNLTQNKITSAMLTHWSMLEKFRTRYAETSFSNDRFNFTKAMFASVHMKAFEFGHIALNKFEQGISTWKDLEYLKLIKTAAPFTESPIDDDFFDEIGQLGHMKYLSLTSTGTPNLPDSICNLKELVVLYLEQNDWSFESIPHCLSELTSLEVLIIDVSINLSNVPLSLFNLPNIKILSLFKANFDLQSILDYNLPNGAVHVDQWFNDNFDYHTENVSYYLAFNPICAENMEAFPQKFKSFFNETSACKFKADGVTDDNALNSQFCAPWKLGDGYCHVECISDSLHLDDGDCIQLCLAKDFELTNCTMEKLTNGVCDKGCDNLYCSKYSNPKGIPDVHYRSGGEKYVTDFFDCVYNNQSSFKLPEFDQKACYESSNKSIFIDPNIIKGNRPYQRCTSSLTEPLNDVGDGECDDACRTEECEWDRGDCSRGCVDDICYDIFSMWSLLMPPTKSKLSNKEACRDIWPLAIAYISVGNQLDKVILNNCTSKLIEYDFNEDGYVNFREWTALSFGLLGNDKKGNQINCSQCVGMDAYNI